MTIWGVSAGAGSVLQHVIANGGKTSPRLFRAAMTSSTFLPSQYGYNDRIPEVCVLCSLCLILPSDFEDSCCIVRLSTRPSTHTTSFFIWI